MLSAIIGMAGAISDAEADACWTTPQTLAALRSENPSRTCDREQRNPYRADWQQFNRDQLNEIGCLVNRGAETAKLEGILETETNVWRRYTEAKQALEKAEATLKRALGADGDELWYERTIGWEHHIGVSLLEKDLSTMDGHPGKKKPGPGPMGRVMAGAIAAVSGRTTGQWATATDREFAAAVAKATTPPPPPAPVDGQPFAPPPNASASLAAAKLPRSVAAGQAQAMATTRRWADEATKVNDWRKDVTGAEPPSARAMEALRAAGATPGRGYVSERDALQPWTEAKRAREGVLREMVLRPGRFGLAAARVQPRCSQQGQLIWPSNVGNVQVTNENGTTTSRPWQLPAQHQRDRNMCVLDEQGYRGYWCQLVVTGGGPDDGGYDWELRGPCGETDEPRAVAKFMHRFKIERRHACGALAPANDPAAEHLRPRCAGDQHRTRERRRNGLDVSYRMGHNGAAASIQRLRTELREREQDRQRAIERLSALTLVPPKACLPTPATAQMRRHREERLRAEICRKAIYTSCSESKAALARSATLRARPWRGDSLPECVTKIPCTAEMRAEGR